MAAPESSALEMKPRAPLPDTSGPKSDESRLEIEDHGRSAVVGGDPLGDVEAVEVGEVDVEQHEVGVQPAGLRDRRSCRPAPRR